MHPANPPYGVSRKLEIRFRRVTCTYCKILSLIEKNSNNYGLVTWRHCYRGWPSNWLVNAIRLNAGKLVAPTLKASCLVPSTIRVVPLMPRDSKWLHSHSVMSGSLRWLAWYLMTRISPRPFMARNTFSMLFISQSCWCDNAHAAGHKKPLKSHL